ncbi:4a-hydroxytetrahydrobiopterin dehydratase, partial [Streptomyces fradiae]|uniref:4a-hydroxytetrahydrobiopterin dehydratase n=1 Tax=Streptomyces fradiae TaxID=1906 RepID=UPI00369C5CC8
MPAGPLPHEEIEDRLRELPGWAFEADRLTRTYRLAGHFAAAAMVVHIARVQEELNHHSDLTLGYDSGWVWVVTHHPGGA